MQSTGVTWANTASVQLFTKGFDHFIIFEKGAGYFYIVRKWPIAHDLQKHAVNIVPFILHFACSFCSAIVEVDA